MKSRVFLDGENDSVNKIALAGFALLLFLPSTAQAYDWAVVAKVTAIEGTYMPVSLPFKVDTASGSCPAGTLLTWNIRGADATQKAQNAQAILSILMTAKSSGQTVTIFGNNAGCTVDYIYLT